MSKKQSEQKLSSDVMFEAVSSDMVSGIESMLKTQAVSSRPHDVVSFVKVHMDILRKSLVVGGYLYTDAARELHETFMLAVDESRKSRKLTKKKS